MKYFFFFLPPTVCIYQVMPAPLLLPLNLAAFLQSICLRHTQTRTHTHKYSTFAYRIPAVPFRPSPRRDDRIICHAPFISTCHRLVALRPLFLLIVFLWPPPRHDSFSHTYQTLAAFQLQQYETWRKLFKAKRHFPPCEIRRRPRVKQGHMGVPAPSRLSFRIRAICRQPWTHQRDPGFLKTGHCLALN